MAYELVSSGGVLDATEISRYEGYLGEGEMCLLELDLRWPASQTVASWLEKQMRDRGVPEARVVAAGSKLSIYFRKAFPWLFLIVTLALSLAILIVSWRLFHELPEEIKPFVGIGAIVVLAALAIGWARR